MTCDFTSFSTVFQSYQDDDRLIIKGCAQWNPVYGCEEFASSAARTRVLGIIQIYVSYFSMKTYVVTPVLQNVCCDPSLEPSQRDGSNDRSQHMF